MKQGKRNLRDSQSPSESSGPDERDSHTNLLALQMREVHAQECIEDMLKGIITISRLTFQSLKVSKTQISS